MYFWAGTLVVVGLVAMICNFFFPPTTAKWFDVLFFIAALAVAYRIHLKEKEQKIESLEKRIEEYESEA